MNKKTDKQDALHVGYVVVHKSDPAGAARQGGNTSKETAGAPSQAVPSELAKLQRYHHNEHSKNMHDDPCGEFYRVEDVQALFASQSKGEPAEECWRCVECSTPKADNATECDKCGGSSFKLSGAATAGKVLEGEQQGRITCPACDGFHSGMGADDVERDCPECEDGTVHAESALRHLCAKMVALHEKRGTVLTVHMDCLAKLLAATPAAPLAEAVHAEEKLVDPDNLPRWIDNLKGNDPTVDALIEYIIKLRTPAEPAPILPSAEKPDRASFEAQLSSRFPSWDKARDAAGDYTWSRAREEWASAVREAARLSAPILSGGLAEARIMEIFNSANPGEQGPVDFARDIESEILARLSTPGGQVTASDSLPYESLLNGFISIMGIEDSGDLLDDARCAIDKVNALIAGQSPAQVTGEPVAWAVYALFDGKMVPQFPVALDMERARRHAEMFRTCDKAEVRPLYAAPVSTQPTHAQAPAERDAIRDQALEEAARWIEDYQAKGEHVSFSDIAFDLRKLKSHPSASPDALKGGSK